MPGFEQIGSTDGTVNQYGTLNQPTAPEGEYKVYIDSKTDTLLVEQKVGANTTDTLERFTLDGKQYQRVTGNFSLNPNSPKIFAGYIRVDDNPPGGPNGGDKALKSNPWFNPSFLANFNNIMAECFDLNSKTRFLEGTLEIKGGQLELALAKDKSEMTKLATDARVSAKQMEAFSCFAQAAVSAVALKSTMSNSIKARETCEGKVAEARTHHENNIKNLQQENKINVGHNNGLQKKNETLRKTNNDLEMARDKGPVVSTDRDAVQPTEEQKKKFVDEKNAEIEANNKKIEDNETIIESNNQEIHKNEELIITENKELVKVNSPRHLDSLISTEVQMLNQKTNMQKEIMSNVINGSCKFVESSYDKEAGYIDAFIQELDGYSRAMSRYTDAASKAEGKSASLTDAINNLMMKITDNSFQASNIGHALG